MSTDRDVTRIVRSWLHEDAHEDADRILNLVLDEIDTTPQRSASWLARRYNTMNSSMRLAVAVAVAAVIAIAGYAVLNGRNVGSDLNGSPSQSTSATSSPSAIPLTQLYISVPGLLPAGQYAVDARFEAGFTLTVPKDWSGLEHRPGFALLIKTQDAQPFDTVGNVALLGFYKVTGAFEDPCLDDAPIDPAPQGIDGFVDALTHEVGIHAGPVTDVVVGGLPAKSFDITSSIDYANCPNVPTSLWTFNDYGTHTYFENNTGGASRLWLVEVHGTLILINAEVTELATDADAEELYRMVDSVQFE